MDQHQSKSLGSWLVDLVNFVVPGLLISFILHESCSILRLHSIPRINTRCIPQVCCLTIGHDKQVYRNTAYLYQVLYRTQTQILSWSLWKDVKGSSTCTKYSGTLCWDFPEQSGASNVTESLEDIATIPRFFRFWDSCIAHPNSSEEYWCLCSGKAAVSSGTISKPLLVAWKTWDPN